MTNLILPGDYEYNQTLGNINLYWEMNKSTIDKTNGDGSWVYSPEGLPRWVSFQDMAEYLGGGEYDERQQWIEDNPDPIEIEEFLHPIGKE